MDDIYVSDDEHSEEDVAMDEIYMSDDWITKEDLVIDDIYMNTNVIGLHHAWNGNETNVATCCHICA